MTCQAVSLWMCTAGYVPNLIARERKNGRGYVCSGILTTAGHLLFAADASGNLLALDLCDGHVLWHTSPGGAVDDDASMT
jgi:glucose dehydrogenase